MTQVNSSPGVPRTLATVVASSATPVLAGPPIDQNTTNILGTGVVSTGNVLSWTSSTGATNVFPALATASALTVPFTSSTPIIYGPVLFNGTEGGTNL